MLKGRKGRAVDIGFTALFSVVVFCSGRLEMSSDQWRRLKVLFPDGFNPREALQSDFDKVKPSTRFASINNGNGVLEDVLGVLRSTLSGKHLDLENDVELLWDFGFAFHCLSLDQWGRGPLLDIENLLEILLLIFDRYMRANQVDAFAGLVFRLLQNAKAPDVARDFYDNFLSSHPKGADLSLVEKAEFYRLNVLTFALAMWLARNLRPVQSQSLTVLRLFGTWKTDGPAAVSIRGPF